MRAFKLSDILLMLALLLHPFEGLTRKSINHALTGMAQRAPVAGFVQIVLYPIICFTEVELRSDPLILACWGLLWITIISRIVQRVYSSRLLAHENGIFWWRLWFGFGAQGICLAWGLTCAYTMHKYGLTSLTSSVLIACLATIALYSASYPLDLLNNVLFQVVMLLPPATVIAFSNSSYTLLTLGAALYLLFSINMAFSLRRSQVQLLSNVEQLERLHEELKVNHELIRTMLASIDEVFLVLGLDGRCMMSASQKSKELLGLDPMGKHFNEILRADKVNAETYLEWFATLTADKLDFAMVAGLGPESTLR